MKLTTGQLVIGAAAIAAIGYFGYDWWKKRHATAPTQPVTGAVPRPTAPAVPKTNIFASTLTKVASGSLAQSTTWGTRGSGSAEQPEDLYGGRTSYNFSV